MILTAILKVIAREEGIQESQIIWDEVNWFNDSHKGHGAYELLIRTNDGGEIETIEATCMAINVREDQCPHYNTGYSELSFSQFYSKDGTIDEDQKQRREGVHISG